MVMAEVIYLAVGAMLLPVVVYVFVALFLKVLGK